ncbi:kinesin-like protein KIN-12E [Macadamia integrifolia]|uniref:kinesin-like protein KIN-12E n=1 Tax=Macadamia integrifolia TaxID=60698 RepID=UPI001C4EB9AC|nr:kinesin-like protein KIN-12E [Macadamia integrifolia]
MPIFSEQASAIRSRFRFQEPSDSESVQSTPVVFRSQPKENNFLLQSSVSRSICERDDHGVNDQSFEFQEDPFFWKDHNVQVIIRIRPLNKAEISLQGYNKCVRQESCQTVTWTGPPESRFTFDLVADENVSQEKLFKVAGLPMVDNCMGGYNSCMFAYGQTGSGKTHTMLGDIEGGTRRHSVNCGMTPRVYESLFSRIQKEKESRREEKLRFTCKCSFLEIYNEQILDLLDPSSVNLQIREDAKRGVYVENLKEVEVTSARDVIQQLVQGAANRKVAATNMNLASSRSHSVFTCVIESKWESQGVTHHRFARLNLVDLAGSERQKSSGAEGERLKEATNINKSLSTLGLVIMNLVSISNGKSLHVPYRDSKLTFLLQDSLGGNSKTVIIANISPSNCCSLETLSTLKFAQRAKFIKNNAIVNEDASGDVLAMRMQIQQLKKEVSHLRGLVHGGAEKQENDNWTVCFPGSPGSFKWEGLQGSFSPLTSDKRGSQKREYETALVGAFRREKDKEIALQALAGETQAAMQLAKQREDEIQSLKMRLRFREAGIKRLEAVASGKISAETHLLQEKEEHLKEIEVLRTQVDRNQEVTRFAMENLQLKEEVRRLKLFVEDGEREMMNEQIMILQNKLLEALDWKLMHEADSRMDQKGSLNLDAAASSEVNLLISSQEPPSPWHSSMSEENEFLRMQAIQNQSEMDALHKKLNICLEEKEILERRVNDLVTELEEERASRAMKQEESKEQQQADLPLSFTTIDHRSNITLDDQMELKTMVDAIAVASQREAQAHESAILLAKENEELRMKLKVLLEDNNKLIELYERAVAETKLQVNSSTASSEKKEVERTKEIENLEHQLHEMQEENEKLMGLYEKAMQEKDEHKRMLSEDKIFAASSEEKEVERRKEVENLVAQLREMQEENDKLMGLYEKAMQERDEHKRMLTQDKVFAASSEEKEVERRKEIENLAHQLHEMQEENDKLMGLYEEATQEKERTEEIVNLAHQLEEIQEENEKLMGLYEKAMQEKDEHKGMLSQDNSSAATSEGKEVERRKEIENLAHQLHEMQEENDKLMGLYEEATQEKEVERTKELVNLAHQLEEIQEENEKLMGLYEKAMLEKDEHKGMLSQDNSSAASCEKKEVERRKETENLAHQLHEMQEENDRLMGLYEEATQENEVERTKEIVNLAHQLQEIQEENEKLMGLYEKAMQEKDEHKRTLSQDNSSAASSEEKEVERTKEVENLAHQLHEIQEEHEKLMGLYEKAMQEKDENKRMLSQIFGVNSEVDKLSDEIEAAENVIKLKEEEVAGLKLFSSEIQERRTVMDNKFLALKSFLCRFPSSFGYWEQREAQARSTVNVSSSYVNQKKEELSHLQAQKDEIEAAQRMVQQCDAEIRSKIICLKSKVEEEHRRQETEKVLLAIDNVDKKEVAQRNWQFGVKATELLKSEEELPKLQAELKQSREKLDVIQKEIENLRRSSEKLEGKMHTVEEEIQTGLCKLEKMELKFQQVSHEKEILLESIENKSSEVERMILEYQQCIFESELKKEEMKETEEELQREIRILEELREAKVEATQRKTQVLDDARCIQPAII